MDVPYYRDQSRMFFVALVCALAGTGKRFSMLDVGAAIASPEILDHALSLSSDAKARSTIEAQLWRLGYKAGETFTMPKGCLHSESYGPEGAVTLFGRRL
jgi:hypothetical protein